MKTTFILPLIKFKFFFSTTELAHCHHCYYLQDFLSLATDHYNCLNWHHCNCTGHHIIDYYNYCHIDFDSCLGYKRCNLGTNCCHSYNFDHNCIVLADMKVDSIL